MSNSLISIIIPVYKVEQYLRECVDSALQQTYTNLEIILVNDGSPDTCGLICDEYALKDSRIRVIHKVNGGLSDARNAGLDSCKGDYIAFVDSDDAIHPQYIELLYGNVKNADLVICDYLSFDEGTYPDVNLKKELKITNFTGRELLSSMLKFRYPITAVAWNKLYKRSIWSELRYPYGKIHEDEFVIHQILDKCDTVRFLDTDLYYYRQRQHSIMSSSAQQKNAMLDKLEALAARRLFFLEHSIEEELTELNGEILYRCLSRAVTKDNPVWQSMKVRAILFTNNLPWQSRMILLIKKSSFRLYMNMYNLFKG